jgi:hypothetical protein
MTETPQSGDHRVHIGETEAKGGRNVGLIWMLLASLLAGVLVMGLVLVFFASSLGDANSRGGPSTIGKGEAAKFHAPAPYSPAKNY